MSPQFVLPEECCLPDSLGVHADLAEVAANPRRDMLAIDATQVREADLTLVQILLAARRTAIAAGLPFTIDCSPVVSELLARSGLAGWPNLPDDEGARPSRKVESHE